MKSVRFWLVPIVTTASLLLLVACPPKPTPEPERPTDDPEPERSVGGVKKKLMPPELKDKVDQVFYTMKTELERCYNDYVLSTGNTKLKGSLIIAVRIGHTPRPTKVWFMKNTFTQKLLNECFLEKIRNWQFPTWGGVMDYSFPTLNLEEL
jgi:hypothetical protein